MRTSNKNFGGVARIETNFYIEIPVTWKIYMEPSPICSARVQYPLYVFVDFNRCQQRYTAAAVLTKHFHTELIVAGDDTTRHDTTPLKQDGNNFATEEKFKCSLSHMVFNWIFSVKIISDKH